jgi:antibiotic biosynthesis monooxygenase (ABM) superfamily enzyme
MAAPAAVAAGALAAAALVHVVDPNDSGNYPTCPFLALTGRFCPGCGSLRALHALTNGDIGTAVGLNVLTVVAVPLLAYLWLRWTARRARRVERTSLADPRWLTALAVLVVLFWIVRNLPFGAVLAP